MQADQHPDEHPEGAIAAVEQERHQDQPDQTVGADDVAHEQQRAVREADHEQHRQVPATQHPPHGRVLDAAGDARPDELHHPVAEQEREQRIRPTVDGDHHDRLHHLIERRAIQQVRPDIGCRPPPQEPRDVRGRDQQQHEAAREVGRERSGGRHGQGVRGHEGRHPVCGPTSVVAHQRTDATRGHASPARRNCCLAVAARSAAGCGLSSHAPGCSPTIRRLPSTSRGRAAPSRSPGVFRMRAASHSAPVRSPAARPRRRSR